MKNFKIEYIENPEDYHDKKLKKIFILNHFILVSKENKNSKVVAILHPKNEKDCRIKKAVNKYIEFNFKNPKNVLLKNIEDLKDDTILVYLGKVDSIVYINDKEGKKLRYEHEFGEESNKKPDLFTNEKGNILIIYGGNFKIKDWIYD
ncbi:MAG: hypothetical protein RMJ67_06030 [Elusimicrobiota bacterium]|nr:hypothetical protein [Endomicrobiia bacterium]MDW8166051.1 hypothetical protein [Elusimicrobiota bacterium]